MFLHDYTHTIDDKGRIIMPVKYRAELGGTFYITKDIWNVETEKCLFVYSEEEFKKLSEKLLQMESSDAVVRAHHRSFFPMAQDAEADAQGRVLIDPKLREYAGLKKDITLAGMYDHIEIWDTEAWESYNAKQTDIDSTGQLTKSFKDHGM